MVTRFLCVLAIGALANTASAEEGDSRADSIRLAELAMRCLAAPDDIAQLGRLFRERQTLPDEQRRDLTLAVALGLQMNGDKANYDRVLAEVKGRYPQFTATLATRNFMAPCDNCKVRRAGQERCLVCGGRRQVFSKEKIMRSYTARLNFLASALLSDTEHTLVDGQVILAETYRQQQEARRQERLQVQQDEIRQTREGLEKRLAPHLSVAAEVREPVERDSPSLTFRLDPPVEPSIRWRVVRVPYGNRPLTHAVALYEGKKDYLRLYEEEWEYREMSRSTMGMERLLADGWNAARYARELAGPLADAKKKIIVGHFGLLKDGTAVWRASDYEDAFALTPPKERQLFYVMGRGASLTMCWVVDAEIDPAKHYEVTLPRGKCIMVHPEDMDVELPLVY